MIVAERKPLEEIKAMLEPYQRILILGCGECVSVCMAGGEKEVGILASQLRMLYKKEGKQVEIEEATLIRQCDREYIEPFLNKIYQADVVLSMACGVGVQYVGEVAGAEVIVLPAVDTKFYGTNLEAGMWAERCAGCGNCILDKTAGICPIARCAKRLLNGPCGGSQGGKCEINPEVECAWQLIHDRLKARGQLELLEEIIPVKDWKPSLSGGPRTVVREDVRS
jgi:ferredoxin